MQQHLTWVNRRHARYAIRTLWHLARLPIYVLRLVGYSPHPEMRVLRGVAGWARYGAAQHTEGSGWAMSYGHAEKIAAIVAAMAAGSEKSTPPIDPRLYHRDDVRAVLAAHDIAGLYQLLKGTGLTQRDIARLTGQSQSEVSEILAGRQVLSYELLVRIAEGFAIPRELMGLSWWGPGGTHAGPDGAYGGDVAVADAERVAEMLRRHVIALGPIAAVAYHPLAKLAELLEHLELPGPSPVPLPSQLAGIHVAKVRT